MTTARTSTSSNRRPAAAATPKPEATNTPQVVEHPQTPELYTSACCGFSIGQGNVVLTFESLRCNHFDPDRTMSRVVVGRLVMPIPAAQALVTELNNALQRSGLCPSRAATAGMVAQ